MNWQLGTYYFPSREYRTTRPSSRSIDVGTAVFDSHIYNLPHDLDAQLGYAHIDDELFDRFVNSRRITDPLFWRPPAFNGPYASAPSVSPVLCTIFRRNSASIPHRWGRFDTPLSVITKGLPAIPTRLHIQFSLRAAGHRRRHPFRAVASAL